MELTKWQKQGIFMMGVCLFLAIFGALFMWLEYVIIACTMCLLVGIAVRLNIESVWIVEQLKEMNKNKVK